MKGMPLPFDFQGKGVLDLDWIGKSSAGILSKNCCYFAEPTSVLDSAKIPSRPASSSTLSSSLGGGGGGGAASTDTNPSPGWPQESATATSSINAGGGADSDIFPAVPPSSLEIGATATAAAMDDWESVLSESLAVSPTQEQSILRWIMGDVDDPSMANLNKALQIGAAAPELDFSAAADQLGLGGDQFGATTTFPNCNRSSTPFSPNINPSFKSLPNPTLPYNLVPVSHTSSDSDTKPPVPNPQLMINHHHQQQQQTHNPPLFFPMSLPQQFHLQPRPKTDEFGQQAILDHLFKAAELVQTGNPVLAHGILARLNHQLFPIGKPFNRAAFYCKEALQSLLDHNSHNSISTAIASSPINLIFKIAAYKTFSDVSPLIHFANFTCNQSLLEALDGFPTIHIVDFDIGYGGQWASLMQELALRAGGAPAVRITAVASADDQLELVLTRDNLIQFAAELNVPFRFEFIGSIESLMSSGATSWLPEREAVAVNLPAGALANHRLPVPAILGFVKRLSPRIVVSVDRGCNRTDVPFANHVIHTLQSYACLMESLDAGNVNDDAMQKIERLLLQPGIEKAVLDRFRCPEKMQHWRALFLSSGFLPLTFSNFAESQAECVVKRTPIQGFQVEKRQSSLVLCWQRKELIATSAWRC